MAVRISRASWLGLMDNWRRSCRQEARMAREKSAGLIPSERLPPAPSAKPEKTRSPPSQSTRSRSATNQQNSNLGFLRSFQHRLRSLRWWDSDWIMAVDHASTSTHHSRQHTDAVSSPLLLRRLVRERLAHWELCKSMYGGLDVARRSTSSSRQCERWHVYWTVCSMTKSRRPRVSVRPDTKDRRFLGYFVENSTNIDCDQWL